MMMGLTLFLREAITHPCHVGALCPSSKRLASDLAEQIPPDNPGRIIELGAGTGAITAALLQQKSPQHELIAIERSAKLAKHLTQRFPDLTVIQGDACQLQELLNGYTSTPIHAIVSSLPLRSLPPYIVQTIGQEINHVLKKGGLFVQCTYNLWGKTLAPAQQLKLIHRQWVWKNLPPARIDVFCRA
jgi:phosphatidylethanolamine/phosphatidyl-N-methylethanolamine N-methyltransferase